MTKQQDAADDSVLALYKALTTMGLSAVLLLALLDIIGDDMMSAALHPGFGFHPASFVLFVLVVAISGKRQGIGLQYFPEHQWDYLARATTVLLISLTLVRGYEFFTGHVFAWPEPIFGKHGVGSYTSFWMLAGLTALHTLDAHYPRNPSQFQRWFNYALFFSVFALCFHHLSDIFLNNGHYDLKGLSALSAACLLAVAAFIFPRTVAFKMLFDPRAPKANITSASVLALVCVCLFVLETFAPYPGLALSLTGVMLLGLPIFIFVFRPLEIEARIARGEIDEQGASLTFVPAPRNLDAQANTDTELSTFERGVGSLLFGTDEWKRYATQAGLTFLLAYGAILISRTAESDIAMLWWANTHLAFSIFIQKDSKYFKTLTAFAVALVAANILAGNTLLASLLLTAVTATEGALIGIIARTVFGVSNTGVTLNMMRAFTIPRLMLAVAIAMGVLGLTSIIGGAFISLVFDVGVFDKVAPLFVGSVLGMFSMMPLIVGLSLEVGFRYEKLTPKISYLAPLCILYAPGVFSFYAYAPTTGAFIIPHMAFIILSLPLLALPSLQLAGALVWFNATVYYNFYFGRWLADGPTAQISFLMVLVPSLITIWLMARHQYARSKRAEQRALSFAPNALLTLDDDGRILSISKNAYEWFGMTSDALYGKRLLGFFKNKKALAEELETYFQNNPSGTFEAKAIRRLSTGQELVFSGSVQGNQDSSLPYSYVVSLLDITKEHELEKEKAQLIEQSQTVLLLQDANWNTLQCSEAWCTLTGYSREETLRHDFHDFLHPEDEPRGKTERALILEGKSEGISDAPYRLLTKTGQIKYVQLKGNLQLYGDQLQLMLTIFDLTALEQARAMAETFLEGNVNAYVIQDEDWNYIHASEPFLALMEANDLSELPPGHALYLDVSTAEIEEARIHWFDVPIGEIQNHPKILSIKTLSGNIRKVRRKSRKISRVAHSGYYTLVAYEDITELEQARATAETYLKAGLNNYTITDENFNKVYSSDAALEQLEAESIDDIPMGLELYVDYSEADLLQLRDQLKQLPTGELFETKDPIRIRTAKGNIRSVKRSQRWFDAIDGKSRFLMSQFEDVTDLVAARSFNEALLDKSPAIILTESKEFKIQSCSEAWVRRMGYSREETVGREFVEFFLPEQRDIVRRARAKFRDGTMDERDFSADLLDKHGAVLHIRINARVDTSGGQWQLILTVTDVTELEHQRRYTDTLLNRNSSIILTQGEDWEVLSCSHAWVDQLGYSRDETLGHDLVEFMHPEDAEVSRTFRETKLRRLQGESVIKNTLRFMTKSGEVRIIEMQSVIEEIDGEWRNILTLVDITEIMQTQTQLAYMVEHDELTGLLSRRGMQQRFADGARVEDKVLYVLDIDHFKSVNDSFGHEAGDTLLRTLGETMNKLSEEDGDAIRLGGEEFAVIRRWHDWEDAARFGESLRQALEETNVHWNNRDIHRTASIGFAPLHTTDRLTDVLHLADLVVREAKSTGRNQVMGATEAMMENLRKRGVFIRADEIQAAFEKGEMHYEVQPIWNMESQSIEGFEALVRWDKPDGTRVMPGLFIDLLYEVVREPKYKALKDKMGRDCLAKLSAFPNQYVSFNYTLEQLGYEGAAQDTIETLESIKDHPGREIVIEVSERAMTARVNSALLRKELSALKEAGYKIALDDFGVESSNLNRLQEYPISIVKIDKALISNIATSEVQRATLEGLSLTLKTLGIKMILEGVETEKQADILFDADLSIHQGYLHARPMPPEEIIPNLSKIGQSTPAKDNAQSM